MLAVPLLLLPACYFEAIRIAKWQFLEEVETISSEYEPLKMMEQLHKIILTAIS